jgi:hypothetical protein
VYRCRVIDPASPPSAHRIRQTRSARRAFLSGFLLHLLAVLWVWWRGQPGLRSGALVWMDLPCSLAYLGSGEQQILLWSLLVGGLQWALAAALVALWMGRLATRRAAS